MSLHSSPPQVSREIERKFLIRQLPPNLKKWPHREIEQGYLAAGRDGTQVRLRKAGTKYSLTCKSGLGMNRQEREIELTRRQFDAVWPATRGRRLRKTRYDVPFGNLTIEIDVYGGSNAGLIVAEVEFDNEWQCRRFEPPEWLGRDISGQARYSNVKLARE